MMRALFDVDVLIALFQPDHIHLTQAYTWWAANQHLGWATCPITENGFVRILTQPKYPAPQTVQTAINLLNMAKAATDHAFWPDSISILDNTTFVSEAFSPHSQITDFYLLGLATKNGGRLVTFDQDIKTATISKFIKQTLMHIP
ncbi:MAG: VapC toxin family PIN domain ribonuclease [Alphaproteobacteria bacterium]|nr:VapC toxin family PIN domain ribonuclease [Alphaproteobacteria bacterium]